MKMDRRALLGAAAAATAAAASHQAVAIKPIKRSGTKHMQLSLAAYSLRGHLSGKNPKMTLSGFVDYAATLDLDAVITALRSHQFDTVLGEIGFDEKGDVTTPGFVWYVWKNGEYVPLE